MGRLDLHTHSCFSDGRCTPEELLALAARPELELTAVALTDHDTVAGIPRFLAAAEQYPELLAIPGVELSTRLNTREIHVVGLFVDPEEPELRAFLEELRQERRRRLERMLVTLAALGYSLDPDRLGDLSAVGRPHVARQLLACYPDRFTDLRQVFDKLLRAGAPGYVARDLPPPDRVIERIHRAGGIAIWAHPVYRDRNERTWLRRTLKQLLPLGLDGIECYYSLYGPGETALVTEFAERFQLVGSGGSDFHGEAGIDLGVGAGRLRVPDALLGPLLERRDRVRAALSAGNTNSMEESS